MEIKTEDQVRNETINKIMTDLRNTEENTLGTYCYAWLVSIGVIKQ